MRTSTRIALTGIKSAAYVFSFIQIYLFIRTYMSALVDMIEDYNKPPGKMQFEKTLRPDGSPVPDDRGAGIPPD